MNFFTKHFTKHKLELILYPYVLEYKNPTDKPLKAVLFGFNKHFDSPNYGNHKDIVVTNLLGYTYKEILAESLQEKKVGKLRIQSENQGNIKQCLRRIYESGNGNILEKPLVLNDHIKKNQLATDIIEVEFPSTKDNKKPSVFNIKPNSRIEFTVQPNSSLIFSFYPIEEVVCSYKEYIQKYKKLIEINPFTGKYDKPNTLDKFKVKVQRFFKNSLTTFNEDTWEFESIFKFKTIKNKVKKFFAKIFKKK